MFKKIVFIVLLLVVVYLGWSVYSGRKYREKIAQQQVEDTKAPQTKITIIEGWSNKDIAAYLEKDKITGSGNFLAAQKNFDYSDYPLLDNKPKKIDLEGFIFPDTYFIPTSVPSGTEISDIILTKALDNFSAKVTPQIVAEGQKNGLNLTQLITLASILEKEGGKDLDEKKIIAGVFYNRLKDGMPLQSDATVNYATGKNEAQATIADTKIDSPYNTYEHTGLPPGPICNPGLDSILAAAEPTQTDYLYFLTDPATGKAVFAETLEEHNANRAKYLN
jgi:UPF0755 protein